MTDFVVRGQYGHQNDDGTPSEYWFEGEERIREPNKEAFAEYYGRLMIEEGEIKQEGIDSIEEFLPSSKEHMDKILDAMIEGER